MSAASTSGSRSAASSPLRVLLSRRKLVVTAALLISTLGALFWLTMPRQEDPSMPDYWGQVVVSWPGADAMTVERQLLDPVERQLAKVEDVAEIEATAYRDMAHLHLELRQGVEDTDAVWDDVRRALEVAADDLPPGAGRPRLDADLQDQESIVIAFTGDPDLLRLQVAAESLEDALLDLPLVNDVRRLADPGEQVTIAVDDQALAQLGLSTQAVVAQLRGRTQILPGGSLHVGDHSLTLKPASDLKDIEEMRATPLALADGSTVPLGSLATVRLESRQPEAARMRHDGVPSVGLGVVPRSGANIVEFGESVRSLLDERRSEIAPIEIHEVIFQPERVAGRLSDLARSLLLGIVIVACVLLLAMGPRLGFLVAAVVPLVVFSSLAVFALYGGTLQQISVAAFVIALGMLVDNAIVMTESMQWRIDRGVSPLEAATESVRELALPLAAATATTMAVFVPMLLSEGATAEFTRSIPIVLMITLSISCLYALVFTPAVASRVLKPRPISGSVSERLDRFADWIVRRRQRVLLIAAVALFVSVLASRGIRQEFFPDSDRNQFLVEIELPEGSHLEAASRAAETVEAELLARPDVEGVLTMVGRSLPHFYYNLNQIPWSPHLSQIVVETTDVESVDKEIEFLRRWAERNHPEFQLVARALEQGPPVLAPVELRLFADRLEDLSLSADLVSGLLQEIPGTADVRHDLGTGGPLLRIAIDDAAAARRGVDRQSVSSALYGRTRGTVVGELREGDDPIPVLLRSVEGEDLALGELPSLDIRPLGGQALPLSQVVKTSLDWEPAAVQHRDRRRVVRVLSQLQPGYSYSEVLSAVQERIDSVGLPKGVSLEIGGAAEGSGEANDAMLRTLPVGALLLFGILLAEFNSFRRLAIVLSTVPLAAAGVVPGLLFANQPFGFMSFLGIIALVGVVVNNAIVLLDLIETERRSGASVEEAVAEAVRRRTRPILLTSATTVAGLLPLTFSGTTLWPPLAWAMISGLLASTGLSLAVVPALYLTLFGRHRGVDAKGDSGLRQGLSQAAMVASLLLVALLFVPRSLIAETASHEVWTVERVVEAVEGRPAVEASRFREIAAEERALAAARERTLPTLETTVGWGSQERDVTLETPVGDFEFGSSRREHATVALSQPILDPTRRAAIEAAEQFRAVTDAEESWLRSGLALDAIDGLLRLHEIDARRQADEQLRRALREALRETEVRVRAGRELAVSALKIDLALLEVDRRLDASARNRKVAARDLARRLGRDPQTETFEKLGSLENATPTLAQLEQPLTLAEAVAEAFESRSDLASSEFELQRIGSQQTAVRASRQPRLDVQLAAQWDTATPYSEDKWLEGGVVLSWRPFQAGRRRDLAALDARRSSQQELYEEARSSVVVEVAAGLARLETANEEREIARRGLELALETERVETVRYEAGRVTANDWLQAESELARRRFATNIARVAQIRAWWELQRLLGR